MRIVVSPERLAAFKASWPCHNISDAVARVVYEFDPKTHDLIDVRTLDDERRDVDAGEDSGVAIGALAQHVFLETTGREQ